tara:strand:+ start:211 stop:360 length:150 start_codon:yes stop_codon:yes gene_type:complete
MTSCFSLNQQFDLDLACAGRLEVGAITPILGEYGAPVAGRYSTPLQAVI